MKRLDLYNKRTIVLARFTRDLARLSKCEDRHVAALITNADGSQIYSMGVNGGPRGGAQCLCKQGSKYTCIHAEANALAKCTSLDEDKVMFTTLSPCVTCAALMANSGVSQLFYLEDYKDDVGLRMLRALGIRITKLDERSLNFGEHNICSSSV